MIAMARVALATAARTSFLRRLGMVRLRRLVILSSL